MHIKIRLIKVSSVGKLHIPNLLQWSELKSEYEQTNKSVFGKQNMYKLIQWRKYIYMITNL